VRRTPLALLLLTALASAQSAEQAVEALKDRWKGLDREGRLIGLMRLQVHRSDVVLVQCNRWLKEKDVLVRGRLVRVMATCATDPKLRPKAEKMIGTYVVRHLKGRAQKEKREFEEVCRKHGRKAPPDTAMAAGRDWKDPYDFRRRTPPTEIVEERAHMREVIAAIEECRAPGLKPLLGRILHEHHDPEVLVATVKAFATLKEWRALPAMADLLRIQAYGRITGGGDVIGTEKFSTLRLKWDLHKDRLWWSRPEYVPRVKYPIYETASAITGTKLGTARELDAWILAHEELLRRHRVKLSDAFKRRAKRSQG
jgi:hypothetical protein